MNEEERWTFITALDDELLKGGVILSEWCSWPCHVGGGLAVTGL